MRTDAGNAKRALDLPDVDQTHPLEGQPLPCGSRARSCGVFPKTSVSARGPVRHEPEANSLANSCTSSPHDEKQSRSMDCAALVASRMVSQAVRHVEWQIDDAAVFFVIARADDILRTQAGTSVGDQPVERGVDSVA